MIATRTPAWGLLLTLLLAFSARAEAQYDFDTELPSAERPETSPDEALARARAASTEAVDARHRWLSGEIERLENRGSIELKHVTQSILMLGAGIMLTGLAFTFYGVADHNPSDAGYDRPFFGAGCDDEVMECDLSGGHKLGLVVLIPALVFLIPGVVRAVRGASMRQHRLASRRALQYELRLLQRMERVEGVAVRVGARF